MKTTPTFVTVQIDYDRRLVLTTGQAAIVLRAVQGAPFYKRGPYRADSDGTWIATNEVLKIETVRADQFYDEEPGE